MENVYRYIKKVHDAKNTISNMICNSENYEDVIRKYKDVHKESILHMIRCSENAKYFAMYLGFDSDKVELISECALLHDIGKLAIDPKILYKEGKLTEIEWNIIKSHPDVEGLENTKLDIAIKDSIYYHHHKVSDYFKNDIHYLVKLVTLLDSFDAMSYRRCYKRTVLSVDEILNEIEKNIGNQFDEYYGRKFIRYIESDFFNSLCFYGKNVYMNKKGA